MDVCFCTWLLCFMRIYGANTETVSSHFFCIDLLKRLDGVWLWIKWMTVHRWTMQDLQASPSPLEGRTTNYYFKWSFQCLTMLKSIICVVTVWSLYAKQSLWEPIQNCIYWWISIWMTVTVWALFEFVFFIIQFILIKLGYIWLNIWLYMNEYTI